MQPQLTRKAEEAMHKAWDNEKEAWALLRLIDAEFQSDPTSTQCFDLRVVERVKQCLATYEWCKQNAPLYHYD